MFICLEEFLRGGKIPSRGACPANEAISPPCEQPLKALLCRVNQLWALIMKDIRDKHVLNLFCAISHYLVYFKTK